MQNFAVLSFAMINNLIGGVTDWNHEWNKTDSVGHFYH